MSIDTKLQFILTQFDNRTDSSKGYVYTTRKLKQAFKDESYNDIVQANKKLKRMQKHNEELVYRAGQEWYNKFEILAKSSGYYSDDLPMMKLAREAAGIE